MLADLGSRAFRVPAVRRGALRAAAARACGLVLVFHRISDVEPAPPGLIPSVPEALFRRQLEALLDAGDVVPLEALLHPDPGRTRPRFALTFDDDLLEHHDRVLPVLRAFGLTATFFLTGRALHGLGPLWFERLDQLILQQGVEAASRWLGVAATSLEELAIRCERDTRLQQRAECLPGAARLLDRVEMRALIDAGMTVGFHTLRHQMLPLLPDSTLDEALALGRRELEDAVGRPVCLFAYPHGQCDRRAACHLRRQGYVAACTGRPRPLRPGDDPYEIGRWEPGAVNVDRFVLGISARLNGWGARG